VRRNQAIVNALEQDRGGLYPVVCISHEPREDVTAISGFQGIAIGALPLLANLALARATSTRATATMLLQGDYAGEIGHRHHENRGCVPFIPSSARSQHVPESVSPGEFGGIPFPQTKNYFFAESKSRLKKFPSPAR